MKIQLKYASSIQDFTPEYWDSIVTETDIFHTHRFLLALEKSKVENTDYQFITFLKEDKLIASAVLSTFVIHLDLLVPQHPIMATIKRFFPNFFKVKICFCGTPVSIGQRNLIVSDAQYYDEVLSLLDVQITDFAKKVNSKFAIFKEFYATETAILSPLMAKLGYFQGYTLPYLKLPIRWNNFDDYLQAMRSNYRRQVVTSWKKISIQNNSNLPYLVAEKDFSPGEFYQLYLSVMDRAAVKLETLNEAFFKYFFETMKDNRLILSLKQNETNLAAVLLVAHGKELTFVWAAKPNALSEYDDYFNLMTGMTKYAIENGFEILNFGQVAFYTKQRLGGEVHQLHLFFKSYSRFWHLIIYWLRHEFFPKIELDPKRIWK